VCLHGYPQTHHAWRKVAPLLAQRFTVVLPDLRGYGGSEIVVSDAAHEPYSKRAMARDVLDVMTELGFARFFVAGHDRGGRVAYRMALDAPDRVAALAVLDIAPTLDTYGTMDYAGAYRAYHWYFLAQPQPLPERLIGGDPDFYCEWTIRSWLNDQTAIEPDAMERYKAWFRSPGAVHAACEDYRAGYTCDMENDRRDRTAGRRIACPVLALWGSGPTAKPIGFLDAWRDWAGDVRGGSMPCGHFLMEEAPEPTARALLDFFAAQSV
jgi:haloacetate dehalogenase